MAKSPIGCCGIHCARCNIYVASTSSDIEKKTNLAFELSKIGGKKISADDVHCWGCWSNNRNCWGKRCLFRKCAAKKGIDFCYQCHEFPCLDLNKFYDSHRFANENLVQISKLGLDAFVAVIGNQGREDE